MRFQIVRLVDHDNGLVWRLGEEYGTLREAMLAGEASIKEWKCVMYRVYRLNEKNLSEEPVRVWESVTPLELKAHP